MAKKNRLRRSAGAEPDKKKQPSGLSQLAQKFRSCADAADNFFSPYILPCEILAVILLLAAGFFFRMENLFEWKKAESQTFYEGQPLHTTFDAYFYLSLAKDLMDGTYNETDEKRGVPDCPPRPTPPPLISVLAAQIAKITHTRLSWVGAVMPAVLGGLLALPLYMLMRYYSGGLAGFSAALLSLLYPFYIYRSGFGRFDTDCLIVTLTLISAYLFLRFALVANWKRYIYCGIGFINYGLFLWWWDQTPAVVTSVAFFPLAVALVFYYRPSKKEALIFASVIGMGLLLVCAVKGPGIFLQMFMAIVTQFLYISKDAGGMFPNIGITISEQAKTPVSTIIEYTTITKPAFIFAFAGLGLLLYRRLKEALFLGSIFLLSVFAFTYANRFIIFLVPALGIGSGYLLGELWKMRKRFLPLFIICPVLLLYLTWPLYYENETKPQYPKLSASTVAGMDEAMHKTPENSVIWAWWDNGYALTYYARRATINDGSIHTGERTCYNALPLACTDFRLAANFMHFYVIRGIAGIDTFCDLFSSRNEAMELLKKIFAAGPADALSLIKEAGRNGKLWPLTWSDKISGGWLPFLFPPDTRPVYLFLDSLLAHTSYWWYWFGTWNPDTKTGIHPNYQIYGDLHMNGAAITGNKGLQLNINTGEIQAEGQSFQLAGLSLRTTSEIKEKTYTANSKYYFVYNEPGRYGALTDKSMAETVFQKLYVRNTYDENYFEPLELSGMIYQLWEVKPDSYISGMPAAK